MILFPSLVPSLRLYAPGDTPQTQMQSLGGIYSSFRRGNRRIGQALQLAFVNLTETELILLQQHYFSQQGSFGRFFLPAAVWSGFARPTVPLISDYTWRYSAPLTVSHASCGRFNVEVQLETEPVDLGDLVFDGGLASALPARNYVLDGGDAADLPTRDFIINSGGAA